MSTGKLSQAFGFGAVAVYAGLLVYCSLFPFSGWRWPDQPLFSFLAKLPPAHVSKSDLLTNLLAYIPFGFILQKYLSRRKRDLASVFAATLIGTLTSFLMESVQMFLPSRTASNIDLASNAAGTLFGAAIALLTSSDVLLSPPFRALDLITIDKEIAAPALLAVALWAGSQLTPFVPSMDVSSVRAGLAPLWHQVGPNRILEMGKVISTALDVGALAILISIFSRRPRRASAFFFVFAVSIFCLKPLIVGRQLSLEPLLGCLAAPVIMTITPNHRSARATITAVSLMTAFAVSEIQPGPPGFHTFNWVPFAAQLEEPLNGVESILEILWPSVALACAVRVTAGNLRGASIVGGGLWALFVFRLEWIQQRIPGRFGDLTTVLLAVVGWGAGWWLGRPAFTSSDTQHKQAGEHA